MMLKLKLSVKATNSEPEKNKNQEILFHVLKSAAMRLCFSTVKNRFGAQAVSLFAEKEENDEAVDRG